MAHVLGTQTLATRFADVAVSAIIRTASALSGERMSEDAECPPTWAPRHARGPLELFPESKNQHQTPQREDYNVYPSWLRVAHSGAASPPKAAHARNRCPSFKEAELLPLANVPGALRTPQVLPGYIHHIIHKSKPRE